MHNTALARKFPAEAPSRGSDPRLPLPQLLAGGGDDRLVIDPVTGRNVYGCAPEPDVGLSGFSSCTASTISERAYGAAAKAQKALQRNGHEWTRGFGARVERLRGALRSALELESDSEIVFSPSGTDSQLHALCFARAFFGAPLTCIVIGADQTGSGTVHTSRGRHFSARTARGATVAKGTPIAAWSDEVAAVSIGLLGPDGKRRSAQEVDAEVIAAVAGEIRAGRKVLLQAMDSSKLGWRAPSDACLSFIQDELSRDVQVAIDACQMRTGRERLRGHLARGAMVLVTGSKFFTGPAFSGATLIPAKLAVRIAAGELRGLRDYATRFDVPLGWSATRNGLPDLPNVGQWLRWEAAVEEMRAYFSVPAEMRTAMLRRLAELVRSKLAAWPFFEALPEQPIDEPADPELPVNTIFPFYVKDGVGYLSHDETTVLYRALGACQIGQPVKLGERSALRIALGARTVSGAWSADPRLREDSFHTLAGRLSGALQSLASMVGAGMHRRGQA